MSRIRTVLSFLVMFSIFPLIGFAFAQDNDKDYTKKLDAIDELLQISIPVGLMGVSLTGAAFLFAMFGKTEDGERKIHMQLAKKNFIKGFIAFLICMIVIFVFDFIEIIDEQLYIQIKILDIICIYSIFAIGLTYLVIAAKHIYRTV